MSNTELSQLLFSEQDRPNSQKTTADQERTAQASKQRQEIRWKYLQPGRKEALRVEKTIVSQGALDFSVRLNPERNTIIGLEWPTKEQDYRVFKDIFFLLVEAQIKKPADLYAEQKPPDTLEAFPHLLKMIGDYLNHMPIFVALNRKSIVVSPAHIGTTPAQHTVNVVNLSRLNQYPTSFGKALAIFDALWHDLGKNFIADGDYTHDHAEISSLILRELYQKLLQDPKARDYIGEYFFEDKPDTLIHFLSNDDLDAAVIRELVAAVKYHHILESIEKGDITIEEFINLVRGNTRLIKRIAGLAMADRLSVEKHYSILALTAYAVMVLILESLEPAETVQQGLQALSTQFMQIIVSAGNVVDELPKYFDRFIKPIFGLFGNQQEKDPKELEHLLKRALVVCEDEEEAAKVFLTYFGKNK